MIFRRIHLAGFLFIACIFKGYSQEIVTGLIINPEINKKYEQKASTKSLNPPDTLDLPFFEDFTDEGPWPQETRWTDNDVFVNNTFCLNPVSQGVATFDALNNMGLLYEEAETYQFEADRLTSVPLNMELDPAENIYLSFFYQPQGTGDPPEIKDSLVLQFYSVTGDIWKSVWKAEGTVVHNFKPVIIKIEDPDYLKKGFRFRFINYASLSSTLSDPAMAGNADQWNIDYIYLDRNRDPADTIAEDVTFTSPIRSVLNTYESMPWNQFRQIFLSEMGSSVKINYRNNDKVIRNVTRSFIITDIYEDADVHSFSAGATNIDPGEWISYDANLIYTFNSSFTDSALFRIRSILTTDEFDRKINDTIDYYQVFSNYFSYDDGSAESGYGINGQGASNAMAATRFRTFLKDTLRAVFIAFNDSYESSNRRYFDLAVWNDNNGIPGDLLLEQEEMVDPGESINGFIRYDLNDPLPVEGYFHVGWVQRTETFLNASLDMNTPHHGKRHYYINGSWQESEVSGSLMIRPVTGEKTAVSGIDIITRDQAKILHIWPNPASLILNIEIRESEYKPGDCTLDIFDSSGRLIISREYTETIDVSALQPGIYFIKARSGSSDLGYNRFIKY